MKTCSKCRLQKDRSAFYKNKIKSDGLNAWCKACMSQEQRSVAGRARNRLSTAAYEKTSLGKLKNKRYRESEKGKAKNQRYNQSPKGKATRRGHQLKYRERAYNLDGGYSSDDEQRTRVLFNHRCFKCSISDRLEIDHNLPLSAGFGLTRDNAVLLCRSCNTSKGTRLPHEFYSSKQLQALECLLP